MEFPACSNDSSPTFAGSLDGAESAPKSKTSCGFTSSRRSRRTWRRGVSPVEARRMALRDLGGLTQVTQAVREVRTIWLDLLWRDARHAVRSLRRTPAFTSVALVVLTLSIGATTAIFSVVDAVILRGLPFPESDRLVAVGELNVKDSAPSPLNLTTPQTFLDWRDQQDVFTGLAAVAYAEISLRRRGGRASGEPSSPTHHRGLLFGAANPTGSWASVLPRGRS